MTVVYEKHHSFDEFKSSKKNMVSIQANRVIPVLKTAIAKKEYSEYYISILERALADLQKKERERYDFHITDFIADELNLLQDAEIQTYIYHRYRYDVFPTSYELDAYPPYINIEPSSVCNYRCVFCYQTDTSFSERSHGFMGSMPFDIYKTIIDQIEGNVHFISLASRGEPLLCKEFEKILSYSRGKFLGLKLNTNASLLNERYIHAILDNSVCTVVFSVDAAKEPLYSKLRVNGRLDKVLRNIDLFQSIRAKQYPDLKIITRVSGVKFTEEQSISSMNSLWGDLVDQVSFVKYNPWENIYMAEKNGMQKPCSDLWRRMFVWYDGSINPCDSDYKSLLSVANIKENNISEIWNGAAYSKLRQAHQAKQRQNLEPCAKCSVI